MILSTKKWKCVNFQDKTMKKENLETGKPHQEIEMKMGDFDGKFGEEEKKKGENGFMEVVGCDGNYCKDFGGYNKDLPPVDDVCPICFDNFIVPCRSNCGHWFCASCILEFWMYRSSSIQPCKCPLCWCQIVNLKPEASLLIRQKVDNTFEVLRKVEQYNSYYVSGVNGIFLKVVALPLFMGRMLWILIDPDGLRCVYYVMRLLGLLLGLLYERWEFEFVPTGGFGIQRMFDMAASLLVLNLFVIGVGYRWVLRSRARRLGAQQV